MIEPLSKIKVFGLVMEVSTRIEIATVDEKIMWMSIEKYGNRDTRIWLHRDEIEALRDLLNQEIPR